MSIHAPRILSFGEVLWDLFPEGARFGGAPANFACHAAILGGEVSVLSAVGSDSLGADALAALRKFGVDTSMVQKCAHAGTGTVGVSVDAAGKPLYEIHRDSAWDHIEWSDPLASRILEFDAFCFGTLAQRGDTSRRTLERALALAVENGIPRVLDINLRAPFYSPEVLRASVSQASILKLSDEELGVVAAANGISWKPDPETMLRRLLVECGLTLVAMTRGAAGAMIVSAAETVDQPGFPTVVRDTVGAGDSFTAALLLGVLRGESLRLVAENACRISAAVCSHAGAVPSP